MKYQNFAVIFILIVLPLSVLLSYYIQNQTDTLVLQSNYQTKLNDSTYDAISAFQMNSLNTQRVTGESVKSYVLASVNTFFTTLATNLGMSSASKQNLLPYVPAILFTTYDGYYIYSPIKTYKVSTDEQGVANLDDNKNVKFIDKNGKTHTITNDNGVDKNSTDDLTLEYSYMLKPFIYYSAKYIKDNDYDIVASYTLDNYVTLYGRIKPIDSGDGVTIDEGYHIFSKSGYLIDPSKITLKGKLLMKTGKRNNDRGSLSDPESSTNINERYKKVIEANKGNDSGNGSSKNNIKYTSVDIKTTDAYRYINYYDSGKDPQSDGYYMYRKNKVLMGQNDSQELRYQTGDEMIESTLEIERQINNGNIDEGEVQDYLVNGQYEKITVMYDGIEITDIEAKEYYVKAYFFSKWVQNNLSNVTASSVALDEQQTGSEYVNFTGDNTKIFDMTNGNDPESSTSNFTAHKQNVIKNSIQFNLNTAISTYNANYYGGDEANKFYLPVISSQDWESILNNVSMATFLQGLPCGLSTFNNYCVIKSNNNNTSVSIENLYFTQQINNTDNDYHKYNCPKLLEETQSINDIYEADLSAEFKYDAKRITTIADKKDDSKILAFFDSTTNTYYKPKNIDGSTPVSTDINKLTIGDELPLTSEDTSVETARNFSYNGNKIDLTDDTQVIHGTEPRYLYDHKNLGCYSCIISNNYTPTVKYIDGKIYRTFTVDDDDSLIIDMDNTYIKEDGTKYTGTGRPAETGNNKNTITSSELEKIRKSVYTAIASKRNGLYKTNDYVNR